MSISNMSPNNIAAKKNALYKGIKPGPHLRLSVSDTGKGIPPEILDKIFDPFFTTKKEGEGTGMGLSVVHGVVESYHGNISVYSKVGEGTLFSVLLPITLNVIRRKNEKKEPISGGSERILLVEDDSYLINAERKVLEELGYKVTSVSSGIEAIELFRKLHNRFDMVITDYIMPKMRGDELIEKIREITPHIPIILCTGYSDYSKEIPPEKERHLKIGEIVLKPIESEHIALSIRKLLDKEDLKGDLKIL